MVKKETKTIVSAKFDNWTVYAFENEGFIEFIAKKDKSTITQWLYACQGNIDKVDEDLLFAAFEGMKYSAELRERAVGFITEVELLTCLKTIRKED